MNRHDEVRQMCEAARQLVDELPRERLDYGEYLTIRDALDLAESEVENLTAENERLGAEAERHGQWIYEDVDSPDAPFGISKFTCSECGWYFAHEFNYCPDCGAKMEDK